MGSLTVQSSTGCTEPEAEGSCGLTGFLQPFHSRDQPTLLLRDRDPKMPLTEGRLLWPAMVGAVQGGLGLCLSPALRPCTGHLIRPSPVWHPNHWSLRGAKGHKCHRLTPGTRTSSAPPRFQRSVAPSPSDVHACLLQLGDQRKLQMEKPCTSSMLMPLSPGENTEWEPIVKTTGRAQRLPNGGALAGSKAKPVPRTCSLAPTTVATAHRPRHHQNRFPCSM